MRFHKFVWLLLSIALLAGIAIAGFQWLFGDLPGPDALMGRLNTPSVRITDRYGRLLYEVIPEQGGRHTSVPLEDIPLVLRQAAIATEDSSFYHNPGVDLRGILRALWINLKGGETLSGGSTITQQVARNLLLSYGERTERSLRRKLRETYLAWKLTRYFSKDAILALYLNQTYYGGMAYGVEAASQTYFGKPVSELDLAESALLVGIPQAPALYNPLTDPEAARNRQRVVLGLMQSAGYITAEQRSLAEREPLVFASSPYPIEAPHFVMMVRAQLDQMFSQEDIYKHGGLVVRTTLDLDWQHHAESAIRKQIEALKQSEDGLGHNVNNAALVALDPNNGEILALVGSPDYFDANNSGAINMVISPRQPGSALKPLVYAAALDPAQANPWTPATMLLDVRTSFVTHDGQAYTPANYDLLEHGPVLVREALASSLNIPAVLTLDHIGMRSLFDLAGKLGITTLKDPDNYDLSLALGGGEVRLIELTSAYGAFANGGYRLDPFSILEVSDLQGNQLYTATPAPKVRVLDARVAWLISDILSDNNARIRGFGRNSILRLDRPAAVKTGTTTNFHDNWTIGYTPDLVVGVWAGNTSYEPMREVNGLTGAAPIWHQFMRTVLTGRAPQEFQPPPGLVNVEICALSGLLPGDACPYRRWEWFIAGTQPTQNDNLYKAVEIDQLTGRLADTTTPPEQRFRQVVLDLPPQAQPWARSQGLTLLSDLAAGSGDASAGTSTANIAALQIISPASSSIYRISSNFDTQAQRLPLEAVGESGLQQVTLWLDGVQVASFDQGPYQFWWTLQPGIHHIWAQAIRENGEPVVSPRVQFEVQP